VSCCHQTANWRLCNCHPGKSRRDFSCGKVMVTLLLNLEQRSRSKRNKWRGPPSAAREGSSPFMPDCFLSVAEGSADRLRLPHSSNDTNRLAILDSDGPRRLTGGLTASTSIFRPRMPPVAEAQIQRIRLRKDEFTLEQRTDRRAKTADRYH